MTLPRKALIVVSSYNEPFYTDGKKTGLFYTEALHPYETFVKNGFEVDFASETGTYGVDEHSIEEPFVTKEEEKIVHDSSHPFNAKLNKLQKPSEIDSKQYGIFFAAGGHATMYDFPNATGLQKIAGDIYSQGGVVAAVCHGPAILPGIKDTATGKYIIEGKTVTGFATEGEVVMGLMDKIKNEKLETMEAAADSRGANFIPPPKPFDDFSQVDGRVVTGSNPASATSTAEAAIKVFDKK